MNTPESARLLRGCRLEPRALASVTAHDLAQDDAQRDTVEDGVTEGGIHIHHVVVSAPLTPDLDHTGLAQISNDPPDGTTGQRHSVGYLGDGTIGTDGYIKKDGPVAGDHVPVVLHTHLIMNVNTLTVIVITFSFP
jgi:hypothetical protein